MNKIFSPKKFKSFLFVIYLIFCSLLNYDFADEIKLNAESVVYDKQTGKVVAENDVRIEYRDIIIETQSLSYDIDKNIIYTTTDTFLIRGRDKLFVKSLYYDINSEKILVKDFYSYYDPYYSYAKSCVVQKHEYLLEHAKVTHCNLVKPHYYFKAKKVIIYPGQKIKFYSPSMVIHKTPVLWLPYYEVSLRPSKDYFVVEPRYENKRGVVTKLVYGRGILQNSELRFLCDTYGIDSIGLGMEYKYNTKLSNGIFYGYLVNEFGKKNRWNLKFKDNHNLQHNWSIKTDIEFISDEQLYSQYEKDNWFIVKRDINSVISVSRDTQKTNFRLSYVRKDIYDVQQDKFVNRYYKIPLEFKVYPSSLWKVKISDSFQLTPSFIESTTYYEIISENNFLTSLPAKMYMLNFLPQIGINTITVKSSLQDKFLWYNIYNFSLPIRYNMLNYGFAEITYNYKIKSENNSVNITISTINVLSNNLNLLWFLRYKKNSLRINTMYNFLTLTKNWYDALSPVITDVNLVYKKFDFNSRMVYNLSSSSLENFNLFVGYTYDDVLLSIGYSRNLNMPDLHFISPQISLYIPNKYQFKLRSALNLDKGKLNIVNTNLELYKDLHCWEGKIVCNIRKSMEVARFPYIFELGGYVSLKFKPYVGTGGKISEVDLRYFPWRE